MRLFILLLFLLTSPTTALATAQIPDVLYLNGEKHGINSNPLQPYLAANPGLLPKRNTFSTANWRGYIATWEIRNDLLLLVDIEMLADLDSADSRSTFEYTSVFSEVFPGYDSLLADWFTGHLVIPTGKLYRYVHLGYGSTYKKYKIATIQEGALTRVRELKRKEFEQFRQTQFAAFKKTEEYDKILQSTLDQKEQTVKEAEEFLFPLLAVRYLSILFATPENR